MFAKFLGLWVQSTGLAARGACLLWDPGLVWTYAGSNASIALAYFAIPITLAIFARQRRDPIFPVLRPVMLLFAGFILLCGITHLLDVLTLWVPAYGLEAIAKIATAVVSMMTAIALWRRLPKLVALPSPVQLANVNAALRASEARYRASFEQSPVPMHILDENGVLTGVSRSWQTLLGYTDQEVIGRHISEFQLSDGDGRIENDWAKLTSDGEFQNLERRYVRRDGAMAQVLASARLEHRNDATWIVCVLIDITERRQVEEALRASEERLHQAQKMEAVGQLTGGIAHDFNNFLQSIMGSLEIIERRIAQGRTTEIKSHIVVAQTAAANAAALTNRMLVFARRQTLQPTIIAVDSLLHGMTDLIQSGIGPSVQLALNLDSKWSAACDANQLESALLNLAINARDAMPTGGMLTISTVERTLTATDLADQNRLRPGDYVEIAVTDTGTGMDLNVLRRAFEPFFTTRPVGRGTGLGLSQVYGFVQQSGGLVRLESKLGHGTTVRLYLPRRDHLASEVTLSPVNIAATPPGEAVASSGSGVTVLVVEDEERIRTMIVTLLREQGYAVIEAADGLSGLQIVQSSVQMDLLVTDVGLPGLNGRQLADVARASRPGLPVLFITGYAGTAFDSQKLMSGMQVLHKPFALDVLTTRIRAMTDGSSVMSD